MKRPLKVLEVLEATEGGTRRHLSDLVAHLDPDRFAVSVACSTQRDPAFLDDIKRMEAKGIRVHVIPMQRAIRPIGDFIAFLQLLRLIRRDGFDVVHTHSSKAGIIGRVAAKLAGVPRVIHTPHTFPFQMDVNPLSRFCYRRCERIAARFCDRMVCVCPSQREIAASLVTPSRVAVVENGIDRLPPVDAAAQERSRPQLGIGARDLVTGVVGRFTHQKGHLDFIEAARHVAARIPEARFLLVGDGELRLPIERAIEAAGLKNRFLVIGSREDVPDCLPVFDLLVLPSLWEGLPYVLLDALRAGRAVVASRVGGMSDIIQNGVNGLLVPPRDPPALAAAMLKLLENKELRSMMGNHARETVANRYRIEDMIVSLAALYEGQ